MIKKELLTEEVKEVADAYIQTLMDSGILAAKILNNKELWESFVKANIPVPVYEVVAYRNGSGKILKKVENTDNWKEDNAFVSWSSYHIELADIYSIKETRTGEVFTVGDKVCWDDDTIATISKFYLNKKSRLKLLIKEEPNDLSGYELEYVLENPTIYNFKHYKEPIPIMITEDGIGIHDRDFLLYAANPVSWCVDTVKVYNRVTQGSWKYFSTKVAMDNWILENKPMFSLKEIREYIKECGTYYGITNHLEKIAQEKLKQ